VNRVTLVAGGGWHAPSLRTAAVAASVRGVLPPPPLRLPRALVGAAACASPLPRAAAAAAAAHASVSRPHPVRYEEHRRVEQRGEGCTACEFTRRGVCIPAVARGTLTGCIVEGTRRVTRCVRK
jgi:hypothetical protein